MKGRVLLCAFAALAALSAQAFAADAFLADRHQAKSVACDACHADGPGKKVSMETCLKCHGGSYKKLAASTAKGNINFHDTHVGEANCTDCHQGHKKPRLVCDECHEFKVRVP
jgi:fumarate reductase flavoprotein subunit